MRTLLERHAMAIVLSMQVDSFPHEVHREQRAFVRKALSVLRTVRYGGTRKALEWDPDCLLIAHGACAETGAARIIAAALSWI